ncbi:hypothetical protein GEV33_005004 [Tenebrio molitor]|jgi:hypothetical protein|uniref:Uncharacterized protein n=1 Tax=Tenebrio molitor TaxID=7067 RepID=A0A8J6HNN2_TENMO|nr:hypothetical protein GEV33_005004 [Tenebrio molitor]
MAISISVDMVARREESHLAAAAAAKNPEMEVGSSLGRCAEITA